MMREGDGSVFARVYADVDGMRLDMTAYFDRIVTERDQLRDEVSAWQDWALGVVGTASTVRSAKKAIEKCVAAALDPKDAQS